MTGDPATASAAGVALAAKIAALREPRTYPERPARVAAVETHMSWVFLTERHAYKLKKPVRYEFLDFSTLAARRHNAEEELRLNRRLAPGVYLGLVPLTRERAGTLRLDGAGTAVEWLVCMRRLPQGRMLDRLIRTGRLEAADVRAVARRLAEFYREGPPIAMSGGEYRARFEQDIERNRREFLGAAAAPLPALVAAAHERQARRLAQEATRLERRAARLVEGHGDLRPEHICLESPPVVFDRLEFNRAFRIVDPADELSFLAMECERLGAAFVGEEFFRVYQEVTGDRVPPRLTGFYKSCRATLRARLALWHTRDLPPPQWPKWVTLTEEYLRLAAAHLRDDN